MTVNLSSFKAYDVRGRIPEEINETLAYEIGRAYAAFVKPRRVAVGYDIRLSSPLLATALKRGLTDCGADVLDIGLCGTEGSYFATFAYELDGGIMVTASHNPPDYNGMKFVREQSRPISGDTGLFEMRALIQSGNLPSKVASTGKETRLDTSARYLEHLLSYIDTGKLRRLKVVVNAGNGGAGLIVDRLETGVKLSQERTQAQERYLAAFKPLYDSFSAAQKQTADSLLAPHHFGHHRRHA